MASLRYLRATGLALIVAVLVAALYVSLERCPAGAIEVEGSIFEPGRCFAVTDGVIRSEAPRVWR